MKPVHWYMLGFAFIAAICISAFIISRFRVRGRRWTGGGADLGDRS